MRKQYQSDDFLSTHRKTILSVIFLVCALLAAVDAALTVRSALSGKFFVELGDDL